MEWQDFIKHAPDDVKRAFICRKHKKGSSILYPDEGNDFLYILTAGRADVILLNTAGSVVTMHAYAACSCFGELELFKRDAKTFDVICQTECETISLHRDYVYEWMKADFEFTKCIMAQLAEKLVKTSQALARLSLLSVKERLMHCVYMHHLSGNLLRLTKAAACAQTCIPLRSLNRALAECAAQGLIVYSKKQFQILSLQRLAEYCRQIL